MPSRPAGKGAFQMNRIVEPGISGDEKLCPPFDFDRAIVLAMRTMRAFELIDELMRPIREKKYEERTMEALLENVETVSETYGDIASELVDMLISRIDQNTADSPSVYETRSFAEVYDEPSCDGPFVSNSARAI
jgi:hypothetical protein